MNKNILEVIDVHAQYPFYSRVLKSISMELHPGDFVAVLGPNGAGKSTFLKIITGLLQPTQGNVLLFGKKLSQWNRKEIAQSIAVDPQNIRIALDFNVYDVVMMGRAPHQGTMLLPSKKDREIVDDILDKTQLLHLSKRIVSNLSLGEQKRVAIARSLAQKSPILILDEATAHLDINHSIGIHTIINQEIQQRQLACIAVMHDLNEASQNANRFILMEQGEFRAQGTISEVMVYRKLRETFGVDIYVGVNEMDGSRYFIPMKKM